MMTLAHVRLTALLTRLTLEVDICRVYLARRAAPGGTEAPLAARSRWRG
jgi:hypothetical protein